MRITRLGTLALAAAALAGCASHELLLAPEPSLADPGVAAAKRVPGKVAYFIAPWYRNTVVRTADGTTTYPYRDLEVAYRRMLGSVFEGVVRVDTVDDPKAMQAAGIRYVVTPEVTLDVLPAPALGGLASTFTVELTSNVRCPSGPLMASPQVVAQATTGTVETVTDRAGAGRRAIAEAIQKTQDVLLDAHLDGASGACSATL